MTEQDHFLESTRVAAELESNSDLIVISNKLNLFHGLGLWVCGFITGGAVAYDLSKGESGIIISTFKKVLNIP